MGSTIPTKIEVEGLYKVFGRGAQAAVPLLRQGLSKDEVFKQTGALCGVNDVNFSVDEGEIYVLMGLSGSGKSTLIRLLNRLVESTAGAIRVDGVDVATLPQPELMKWRRRHLAMVFQSFALMPHRNVLDNVAFGLEIAGVNKAARAEAAMRVLNQVGLDAYAAKYPSQLSGGMQQRVGLARALAVDPDILLMDEAFSALDPLKRVEMQSLMLQLQRENKRTVLFVSHDLEEALRIGSRIAIMEGGRLVQVGTAHEIITRPANDYVRRFFKGVDTARYLTAADLLDASGECEHGACESPLHVRTHLAEAMHKVIARNAAVSVVDDEGRVVGCITPRSLLQKIAQEARHV